MLQYYAWHALTGPSESVLSFPTLPAPTRRPYLRHWRMGPLRAYSSRTYIKALANKTALRKLLCGDPMVLTAQRKHWSAANTSVKRLILDVGLPKSLLTS